jgi:ArsR family transcriptional regulator, cadmium/lead-responsive transcriptional repressor
VTTDLDPELWAAVAEPRRLELIEILLDGEASISEVARQVPVSRQATAKHLEVLARAGLVESRRTGREVRFQLDPDRLEEIRTAMARRAAAWDRRLARIKQLAEAHVDDP